MTAGKLRILVVEDSLTIRKHIIEVLSAEPGLEVVGEASNGKTAIELCERLRPNVVTMDMMLPVMTGVAATEWIMAYCPTPILIVSASHNRGELFKTYDALAAGAVDVLDKPTGGESDTEWERRLVSAVRMVARIPVITHLRGRLTHAAPTGPAASPGERRLVALGASTGGPGALLTILRALPPTFPLPILIVLHISEPFGQAMAEWLDALLPMSVRYPKPGEPLPSPGTSVVILAPPDVHLEVVAGRLKLTETPARHSCRPSVDVLFESLAREAGPHTIACLLTGMGRDGAQGLLALRHHGALTIAQDQASSVVFGMPAEAIKLGAATHVLALTDIAGMLVRAASREIGGRR